MWDMIKNSPFPLVQSIRLHLRALDLIPCLIPCHCCEKSAREPGNSHHLIRQRGNIHTRATNMCVDLRGYMTSAWIYSKTRKIVPYHGCADPKTYGLHSRLWLLSRISNFFLNEREGGAGENWAVGRGNTYWAQQGPLKNDLGPIYPIIIVWLCLTRTGSYRVHELDSLKSRFSLLKLINNSSSSNKGNHNREGGFDTRS